MVKKQVPAWALDYMMHWRDVLCLHDWDIVPELSDTPCGDNQNSGCAAPKADCLFARITLNSDIPDTPDQYWQRVIIHELLHVKFASIDNTVEQIILPEIGGQAERLMLMAYNSQLEQLIESLATSLFELYNTN